MLLASVPKKNQTKMSTTMKPQKNNSVTIISKNAVNKGKSFSKQNWDTFTELETLWKIKDEKLIQNIEEIKQKNILIVELRNKIKDLESEVEELNCLVSFILQCI